MRLVLRMLLRKYRAAVRTIELAPWTPPSLVIRASVLEFCVLKTALAWMCLRGVLPERLLRRTSLLRVTCYCARQHLSSDVARARRLAAAPIRAPRYHSMGLLGEAHVRRDHSPEMRTSPSLPMLSPGRVGVRNWVNFLHG